MSIKKATCPLLRSVSKVDPVLDFLYYALVTLIRDNMIWMIEKFKTRLYISEMTYDVDVPIQIEIEYGLKGKHVDAGSISKKVHYNRPLLIKEVRSRTAEELDQMVDQHVQSAIRRHLSSRGYVFDEE